MTKVLVLDERRAPPAVTNNDGKDFVPTNKWVVFGHHFAAIAGPGPLVGPVLAAQFGYLPGTLWILIGATLGGGVHDAVMLFASMRRGGKSLGQMLKEEINPVIGTLAMISLLAIMTILLAVLGLVVVKALAESPWGLFTIAATIPLALVMGLALRFTKAGISQRERRSASSACCWRCGAGSISRNGAWRTAFTLHGTTLAWSIMIYGFAACVLPVWLLLAPRDYLSTFMKLGTVAVLGLVIIWVAPPLQMPQLTQLRRRRRLGRAGSGVSLRLHHHRLRRDLRLPLAHLLRHHAEAAGPRERHPHRRLRRDGHGDAGGAAWRSSPRARWSPANTSPSTARRAPTPAAVVARVTTAGFPVTEAGMDQLAAELGEKTMFGRAGGAPTFAVGHGAHVLPGVPRRGHDEPVVSLRDHVRGAVHPHHARRRHARGTLHSAGSAGSDLETARQHRIMGRQSVRQRPACIRLGLLPLSRRRRHWRHQKPVADLRHRQPTARRDRLRLGTTVLIKMGRTRYVWTTLVPLVYLLAVTLTAGLMLIFNEKFGFLAQAAGLEKLIAAGTDSAPALAVLHKKLFNQYLDAGVAGLFLALVVSIVIGCAWEWWKLLSGSKRVELRESPYVPLADAA